MIQYEWWEMINRTREECNTSELEGEDGPLKHKPALGVSELAAGAPSVTFGLRLSIPQQGRSEEPETPSFTTTRTF